LEFVSACEMDIEVYDLRPADLHYYCYLTFKKIFNVLNFRFDHLGCWSHNRGSDTGTEADSRHSMTRRWNTISQRQRWSNIVDVDVNKTPTRSLALTVAHLGRSPWCRRRHRSRIPAGTNIKVPIRLRYNPR